MAFWVRLTTSSHASSKSGQDFQGISGSVKLDKEKKMILLGNHTSFFFFFWIQSMEMRGFLNQLLLDSVS